jgi:hypothetical protein
MVPSVSLAVAVIVMFVPATKLSPFAGAVMLTEGAAFVPTVILTATDVVAAP